MISRKCLSNDGLVRRSADPGDRRVQRIYLTERGRRARKSVGMVVNQALESMFAGISKKDLAHLKKTLRRVLENSQKAK